MSPRPQIDHIRRPPHPGGGCGGDRRAWVAGARIADVADRAGTSAGAILYWFDSKEDLLSQALTDEEERFAQELRKRLKLPRPPPSG